jgi:hypothetical protein
MDPTNPEHLLFQRYVCAQTRFHLTRERYGARNTVVMSYQWYSKAAFFTQQGNLLRIRRADISQLGANG